MFLIDPDKTVYGSGKFSLDFKVNCWFDTLYPLYLASGSIHWDMIPFRVVLQHIVHTCKTNLEFELPGFLPTRLHARVVYKIV